VGKSEALPTTFVQRHRSVVAAAGGQRPVPGLSPTLQARTDMFIKLAAETLLDNIPLI
jgi:hypothetical protein